MLSNQRDLLERTPGRAGAGPVGVEANAPARDAASASGCTAIMRSSAADTGDVLQLGARGGRAIDNKATVLEELWQRLGGKPRVLYGLCEAGTNYGHAFVAFEAPDPKSGEVRLMVPNIVGDKSSPMVQWLPLEEYLFGIDDFKGANRQRGAYNRPFTLAPIYDERVDVRAMRGYFERLAERNRTGEARFSIIACRVLNLLNAPLRFLGVRRVEYGNCARWNFEGMKAGGVFAPQQGLRDFFTHNTVWPKRIVLRLLDGESRVAPSSVRLVHIPRIQHAVISSKCKHDERTYANAFTRLAARLGIETERGRRFKHFGRIADALVVVPEGSARASVRLAGDAP